MKKKCRRNHGDFHCHVCLDSFTTREELFHHKLEHIEDRRPYRPVEPHFEWENERIKQCVAWKCWIDFYPPPPPPIASLHWVLISIFLSTYCWIVMDGSMKFIRPWISSRTSTMTKASSWIFPWDLSWQIKKKVNIDFLFHMPTMPFSRNRYVSNDHPLGRNCIHNWTRNPWKCMWLTTEKTPSGSHSWWQI